MLHDWLGLVWLCLDYPTGMGLKTLFGLGKVIWEKKSEGSLCADL